MVKRIVWVVFLAAALVMPALIAEEAMTEAEASTPVDPPRPVSAMWSNGVYYEGKVIATKEGQSLVKWADGSGEMWIDNDKIKESVAGKKAPPNARKVYAQWQNGYYYKGLVIETKDGMTLVQWEAQGDPTWIENKHVHPRTGHKLAAKLIGDRELTAAEKKAEAKRKAASKQEDMIKYTASCSQLRTNLDCMRTYDPCTWRNNRCQYRGH